MRRADASGRKPGDTTTSSANAASSPRGPLQARRTPITSSRFTGFVTGLIREHDELGAAAPREGVRDGEAGDAETEHRHPESCPVGAFHPVSPATSSAASHQGTRESHSR
jgi:hypothetical protein